MVRAHDTGIDLTGCEYPLRIMHMPVCAAVSLRRRTVETFD
jgi:hypothetical protein